MDAQLSSGLLHLGQTATKAIPSSPHSYSCRNIRRNTVFISPSFAPFSTLSYQVIALPQVEERLVHLDPSAALALWVRHLAAAVVALDPLDVASELDQAGRVIPEEKKIQLFASFP